jgi:hypothetical protein
VWVLPVTRDTHKPQARTAAISSRLFCARILGSRTGKIQREQKESNDIGGKKKRGRRWNRNMNANLMHEMQM